MARNPEGEVLKIWAISIHSNNLEVVEAMGIFQGLLQAKEEGWSHIWCESDAWRIISCLISKDFLDLHWMVEGVFRDIIHMEENFDEVRFCWSPRKANMLAHFVC